MKGSYVITVESVDPRALWPDRWPLAYRRGSASKALPAIAFELARFDVLAVLVDILEEHMRAAGYTDPTRWEWTCVYVEGVGEA